MAVKPAGRPKYIFAQDEEARNILEQIAEFEALKTGRKNLTSTLHRVLVEELERIKAQGYKPSKKV